MNFLKLLAITVVAVFLLSLGSEATISCKDVLKGVQPCAIYLLSGSGNPPDNCCKGVAELAAAATATEDKKAACECIKSAAKNVTPKPGLVQGLAGNCGVNLQFTISPDMDCSRIG